MKKSARINGDLNNDDKDEGIGDWITITSLDSGQSLQARY